MPTSLIHRFAGEFVDDGDRHLLPVFDSYPPGTAFDDFNRVNGPAGSTPIGAKPWVALSTDGSATPIIDANRLGVSSLGGGSLVLVTVDTVADCEVEFGIVAGGVTLVLRGVDLQNHLVLSVVSGALTIRARIANSFSTVATGGALASLAGKVMRARMVGDKISVWADGVLLIDEATVSQFATATKHGGYFTTTAGRLASPLKVTPIAA